VGLYYDDSRSSAYEQGHLRVSHSFGSGTTWSKLAFDDVEVGPLRHERQYFWQVVGAQMPVANSGGFQAIVGVGPPSTPRSDSLGQAQKAEQLHQQAKADPAFQPSEDAKVVFREAQSLAEEQTLLEGFGVMSFSVCIRREAGSEGYFTWNEDDPHMQPGLFTAVPVRGTVTWGVELTNVQMQVGGSSLHRMSIGCGGGGTCGALVDSGTSLLVLPTEAAQRALQAVDALNSDCSNMDLLPHLVFQLDGKRFALPPDAYLGQFEGRLPDPLDRYTRRAGEGRAYRACELLIMTMDVQTQLGPMWILGLPFFREYYTTFSLGTDIWDQANRSIFLAESDDACRPRMPGAGPRSLAQRGLRRVDLSKVRVPRWVESAAAAGSVQL